MTPSGLPDIAFVGKAGSGKSTAAAFLCEFFGYQSWSFAYPIKEIVERIWGAEAREDRGKKQAIGQVVRDLDPDAWVNLLLDLIGCDEMAKRNGTHHPVVIDDCRYENEWYALKGAGFVIVRISAYRVTRVARLTTSGKLDHEGQLNHPSETAVDHLVADRSIYNYGSLSQLEDDLIHVVAKERR